MKQFLLSLFIIFSTSTTISPYYWPFAEYQKVPNAVINHPEQAAEFTNKIIFELADEDNLLIRDEKTDLYRFTEQLISNNKYSFVGHNYSDVYAFIVDQLIGFIHQKAWQDAKKVTRDNNIFVDKEKIERVSANLIKNDAEKAVNQYLPGGTLPLGLLKAYFGNALKKRITVLITDLTTAECPICRTREAGEPMKIGVCGHPIHYACASKYSQGRTCPTCGEDLVEPCLH